MLALSHTPTCVVLSFLVLATGPSSSSAYELLGADWRHEARPIGKSITVCARGGPANASERIKAAATKWNTSKFRFTFEADRCLEGGPSKRDGVNYIDFGPLADPGITALTDWRNDLAKMLECDIRFAADRRWYVGSGSPSAEENDLFSVALHEFGHCLGLDESKEKGAVMSGQLGKGRHLRELADDDRKGRDAIYGAP